MMWMTDTVKYTIENVFLMLVVVAGFSVGLCIVVYIIMSFSLDDNDMEDDY